ncbi:sulfatase family protein [Flavilitoribacter nigricans]|uniref:Arylsulfatase n=1 Tax=Flavilitoribacter nigricans (strain ATCC 23147 / DSM 23189 / NBRC 102662 / NCIMB 1420 / SS-2) TaxID=1122177 RepID=A0A2D0NC76_FLAN2|nr:arylsulfatase [Flavilitoribacter nigricans]PHN05976.1 arylsulfatase [Flavilitoribacter nigricans DSM 23189 = NBRC 102662]
MKRTKLLYLFFFLLIAFLTPACDNTADTEEESTEQAATSPNIIFIYADDLGYGDVSAYEVGQLSTPNIDRLANGGVKFTNGYASSATCSPSRYALLTGSYPWRNPRAKILPGTAPLLIDTAQMTVPKMLRAQGYHTGVVGKWHLGLGDGNTDWNQHIAPGPNEVGFDYSYIMAATQDRVPTVYIEDGDVVRLDPNDPIEVDYRQNFPGEPTGKDNPEMLKMKWHHGHNSSIVNGIPRIGFMKGGDAAKWVDENMADTFLVRAQDYIRMHKEEPFFLYYALQQPHVPRTPHPRFVGKSGMGPRGDVIVEADWCIGELLKTLEAEGLMENTLIVLSSDNGPVLNDGYYDDAVEKLGDHTPWGPLRGGKYSLFEAGTRVPFISYWQGHIEPTVSDAVISQIDLFASLAELVGSDARTDDSEEMLDVLMGESQDGRDELILEATTRTALRKGDWILIPPYQGPAVNKSVNIELGNAEDFQLYNLKDDLGQQKNLAEAQPEKLQEMIAAFQAIRGTEFQEVEQLELK